MQDALVRNEQPDAEADLRVTPEDYEAVARACPHSAGMFREALDQHSALAYFPQAPSGIKLLTSAIALCALEASGNWQPP